MRWHHLMRSLKEKWRPRALPSWPGRTPAASRGATSGLSLSASVSSLQTQPRRPHHLRTVADGETRAGVTNKCSGDQLERRSREVLLSGGRCGGTADQCQGGHSLGQQLGQPREQALQDGALLPFRRRLDGHRRQQAAQDVVDCR